MITVTLYWRKDCPACDQAKVDLESLQSKIPHLLVVLDVDSDSALKNAYHDIVPVIRVGPYIIRSPFTPNDLAVALAAARDRAESLESSGDVEYQKRIERGRKVTGTDYLSVWIGKHYMFVFNIVLLIFVGLPFLAPVLMKINAPLPASIIYAIYKPFCHQFAFRSWFLFGSQPYYPRELAFVPGVKTYEQIIGNSTIDPLTAREFIGNPLVGYKVAICERDVAIYGSILLFGLLFTLTGKKLRTPSKFFIIWILIGMLPMAIDGFSQLPNLLPANQLTGWLPLRESTPFLRTLTGVLFGITTAWYIFPVIEETMQETRRIVTRKMAVHSQINADANQKVKNGL
jgi:uncharacterized membrane protein